MGSRGPNKKPNLNVLPMPTASTLDATPPDYLGEVGIAAWKATRVALPDLTIADHDALAMRCIAADRVAEYNRILQDEGEFITMATGYKSPHPALAQRARAEKQISDFQRAFGMTPAARAAMNVKPPKTTGGLPTRNRYAPPYSPKTSEAS